MNWFHRIFLPLMALLLAAPVQAQAGGTAAHPQFSLLVLAGNKVGISPVRGVPPTVLEKTAAAHASLRAAILSNDVDARVRHYRADARSMPEYQPALYGAAQIAAYHRAMRERRTVTGYNPVASEVFDLGDTLLEIGSFAISWSLPNGATEEEKGKYANVWGVESDGSFRLKADLWGYFRALPDPKAFFLALPESEPASRGLSESDRRLAENLAALNRKNAEAVRTRNVEAKLAEYSDDAIVFPFADTPKVGMGQLRPYLTAYTAGGAGISFDDVRVWNAGFEDLGTHVIEYAKFQVDWHDSASNGTTKGGGLRFWKRQADGSLKLLRQFGTHDHVD